MVLVDDSIVRGTTSHKIVEMVRSAGAKEVPHADFESANHAFLLLWRRRTGQTELLAYKHNIEEMREIGCDSLAAISMNGLYRAMGATGRDAKRRHFAMRVSQATIYPID